MKKKSVIGISIAVLVFGVLFGIASLPDEVLEPTEVSPSENLPTLPDSIEDPIEPKDLPGKALETPGPIIQESKEPGSPEPQPVVVEEKNPSESPTAISEDQTPSESRQIENVEDSNEEGKVIKVSVSDGVGARQR